MHRLLCLLAAFMSFLCSAVPPAFSPRTRRFFLSFLRSAVLSLHVSVVSFFPALKKGAPKKRGANKKGRRITGPPFLLLFKLVKLRSSRKEGGEEGVLEKGRFLGKLATQWIFVVVFAGRGPKPATQNTDTTSWVAVKEPKFSSHNPETAFIAICPYSGNKTSSLAARQQGL